ncbi:hypothetical protein [Ethanoligenens sp.]|uniref:hypothetical protein n=1 Tax=Ethanoligenens sp. TaxID=2099655 RepID=UPI0039ECE0C1
MPKSRNKDSNIPKWQLDAAIEISTARGTTWDNILRDFIESYIGENMSILVEQAKRGRLLMLKEEHQQSTQQPAPAQGVRIGVSGIPTADTATPCPPMHIKTVNPQHNFRYIALMRTGRQPVEMPPKGGIGDSQNYQREVMYMTHEIKIKGISQETFDKMNLCFSHSRFPDRSAFIINALEIYMLYTDSIFIRMMPDTVRLLTEDVISNELKRRGDLIEINITAIAKITKLLHIIWGLFNNETAPDDTEIDDF